MSNVTAAVKMILASGGNTKSNNPTVVQTNTFRELSEHILLAWIENHRLYNLQVLNRKQ